MFWVELYLIFQMSFWFIAHLRLSLPFGERNALIVLLGLGIKCALLFIFITLGLDRLIMSPVVFSIVVFLLCFAWMKVCPIDYEELSFAKLSKQKIYKFPGFWILFILLIFSIANAYFFPITGADGVWHHVKGMAYALPHIDFESKQIILQFRQYPPLIGLLYGWLISSGFERVTVFFPLLYVCLLYIFYYRCYEHVKNSTIAGLATLILGTTPYLWWHSFLPFLDWTAGVFYAVGVLYWFLLIKNILEPTKSITTKKNRSLALLSGLLFGLASWTRPEFVLYSAVPIFLLIAVIDCQGKFIYERNALIIRFSIAALILPSLWFAVLLNFEGPLDTIFYQLIMGCAGLWVGIGLALSRIVYLTPRNSVVVGVFAVAICFIGLFVFFPSEFSPWTKLAIRFFRLVAVQIFFTGTVFLFVFLFIEQLRERPLAEKNLGTFILLFMLVQFFIYAYSGLKWPTLSHYVENTFVYPGNSINLSDTRGTIAIYPAFVFFIFSLPGVKKGVISGRVKRFLLTIVVINLILILIVFGGPRVKFIIDNFDKSYKQLAESSGPPDVPNQFAKTYQVAHELKKNIVKGQTMLFLSGNRDGSFRSVITQVLFSQNIFFVDDPNSWSDLEDDQSLVYAVSQHDVEDKLCGGVEAKALGETGFVVCQLNKIQLDLLK
jgi:hypothetical protein